MPSLCPLSSLATNLNVLTPKILRLRDPILSKTYKNAINQSINLYLNTVKSIRNLKIKDNLTILNKIQNLTTTNLTKTCFMQPHNSQSIRENATPSNGPYPLAYC